MYNNKLKRGGALSEWHCKNLEKKSKKLSANFFQIDQFNMILYHVCRYIDHYPCYWKIPQHHAKTRKNTQKHAKCRQDEKSTKMKKLPDFFKKYNYFRSFDVKNIPGEKSFQAFQF